MKKNILLLLAAILCSTAIAGCGRPEFISLSGEDADGTGTSLAEEAPAASDIISTLLEKHRHSEVGWSDAQPRPGLDYNLHYGEKTVRAPLYFSGDREPGGVAFFVSNEATAMAYCRQVGVPPLLVQVSGDRGETWTMTALQIDVLPKWPWFLSFSDRMRGFLLFENQTDEYQLYSTGDAGVSWEASGSFSLEGDCYEFFAYEGALFIAGSREGYPMVMRSEDGTRWVEAAFDYDRGLYESGHCTNVFMEGQYAVAVLTLFDVDYEWKYFYYASDDSGQSWVPWTPGKRGEAPLS